MDPRTCKTDTGELSFDLLDARTTAGGSNATRWVTAFLGDTKGTPRLLGLRVEVDESLDGGASWARFFTGRVGNLRLTSRLWYTMTVRDMADDMATANVFVGMPHSSITYASAAQLAPVGLPINFGDLGQGRTLTGTHTINIAGASGFQGWGIITVDPTSVTDTANVVTHALRSLTPAPYLGVSLSNQADPRTLLELTRQDTMAVGRFHIRWVGPAVFDGTHSHVVQILIQELWPTDPDYLALPPNATSVAWRILSDTVPTEESPLYIADVDPVQLWMDILDGKFGRLWHVGDTLPSGAAAGDAVRRFPYDAAAMTALLGTRPPARFVITKMDQLQDWIEANICQPYAFAYALNGAGEVMPIDLSLPTPAAVAGIGTIGDDDLMLPQAPQWEQDRSTALTQVNVKYYEDRQPTIAEIMALQDAWPTTSPSALATVENQLIVADFGRPDLAQNAETIDCQGYRSETAELITVAGVLQARAGYLPRLMLQQVEAFRRPFAAGAQYVDLVCRRTATITALGAGDLVFLQATAVPDPATNQRGGERLVRIVERSENGLTVTLKLLDTGLNATAGVPTISGIALDPADDRHGVYMVGALNANADAVVVQYNLTSTAVGTAPAAGDAGWTFGARVDAASWGIYAYIRNLPGGRRVWLRARSEPSSLTTAALPSVWVTCAPGYVDLNNLGQVTPFTWTSLTSISALLAWVNAETDCRIEIAVAGVPVAQVPAGSIGYNLTTIDAAGTPLAPSTAYTVTATTIDDLGGTATAASTTFTTSGTNTGLPAIATFDFVGA